MAITKLFSMRQKEARGEYPDVYVYDYLPTELIRQIILIITDYLGPSYIAYAVLTDNSYYREIHNILCREYGMFELPNTTNEEFSFEKIQVFILNSATTEEILDVTELCFQKISAIHHNNSTKAINELNTRFKMHGIGYQFASNQIIRIDNELTHQEIIKPTLSFLRDEKYFRGANEEFLKAHEFYRRKEYKQALTECTKAFESCMKGICEKHGWKYEKSWPAKKLIETCLSNNLIPSYMQEHLTQLRMLLESTATPRNKDSAHGQGANINNISEELASYVLNLTASNILFLAECKKKLT